LVLRISRDIGIWLSELDANDGIPHLQLCLLTAPVQPIDEHLPWGIAVA
jgi:hypothetical protein